MPHSKAGRYSLFLAEVLGAAEVETGQATGQAGGGKNPTIVPVERVIQDPIQVRFLDPVSRPAGVGQRQKSGNQAGLKPTSDFANGWTKTDYAT